MWWLESQFSCHAKRLMNNEPNCARNWSELCAKYRKTSLQRRHFCSDHFARVRLKPSITSVSQKSGRGQPHSKTSRTEWRARKRASPESIRGSAAVLISFPKLFNTEGRAL